AVAIDLTLSDPIHIDAPSLRVLGRRLARLALIEAYERTLVKAGPRLSRGRIADDTRRVLRLVFSGVNCCLTLRTPRPGFIFTAADGRRLYPESFEVPAKSKNELRVTFSAPLPDTVRVDYAPGLYPVGGVEDREGNPLPCFGGALLH